MRKGLSHFGLIICAGLLSSVAHGDEPTQRLAVPDAAAQKAALTEVKSVLGDDFAKLSKRDLAEKLLKFGNAEDSNAAQRYVLYLEAGKASIAAGDTTLVFTTVDALAAHFDGVDATGMKVKTLARIAALGTKDKAEAVCSSLLAYSNELAAQEKYEASLELLDTALAMARRCEALEQIRHLISRQKEVALLQGEHKQVAKAVERLKKEPTDPEANLIAGKYYALLKGDWEKGVPLLALGADADLKAAATLDLKHPAAATDQVSVADRWWDLSQKTLGIRKTNLRARAGYWYEQAQPGIDTGLAKTKIEKRLAEIHQPAEPEAAPSKEPPKIVKRPPPTAPVSPTLDGEYKYLTQLIVLPSGNVSRSANHVEHGFLNLSADGTGSVGFPASSKFAGKASLKWSANGNRLVYDYVNGVSGRATYTIRVTGNEIVLEGERRKPDGTVFYVKATKSARRPE